METKAAVRTAAMGLGVYGAARILGIVFASASMASSVGQAIVAEWGAGRLGVTWSDAHAPPPSTGRMAKRALVGAGIGAATAMVVVALAWATRGALVEATAGGVPWSLVVVGLVTSGLHAMRDELVLHGITLRALTSVGSPVARALACGLTSAGAALGDPSATPRSVAVQLLLGVVLGALWVKDRGAWMAWGAHTAWLFVIGTLLGGGIADMRVATSSWGGGDAGITGGTAALIALAPLAIVALALVRQVGSRPHDGGQPEAVERAR